MLKYIKVKNFLSFKEETEINFESSFYGNKKGNVFKVGNDVLMKNMLIYGANASGKSNIIKAIDFVKKFVLESHEKDFFKKVYFSNFLLDKKYLDIPIFLELGFFINDNEYKYNFEILENKVISENLYKILYINKKKKEEFIFKRKLQKIKAGSNFKKELKKGKDKIREDSSIISVLSQWNGELEGRRIDYFFKKINILSEDNLGIKLTGEFIKTERIKKLFIKFLEFADINICDIRIGKEIVNKELLEKIQKNIKNSDDVNNIVDYLSNKVEFGHKVKNSDEIKYFDLENESEGTQKFFSILGIMFITIFNEEILFIDEIENKLHLHILQEILKFINSNIQGNKYQFIFTTHNISLMDLKVLKKEQIGIVEKNKDGESEFYTLYDFDKVREGMDLKKYFNAGVYGGVPNLGDFKSLLDNFNLGEKKEK